MRDVSLLQGPEGRALGIDIIEELAARNLALSACNYELWLHHRLGADGELTRAIESAGAALSQADCEALFEEHIAGARMPMKLAETGASIARELSEVLACLRATGDGARTYSAALHAAADVEALQPNPEQFAAIVRDLAEASRTMAARNESLSAQIEQSAQQVDALQSALADVTNEALTDALTGLANRRCFETALRRHLSSAEGAPFGLILCDIDHFKRINDGWGHPVGDQVIRFVAHVLAKTAPANALVARYGGEEFAVILPNTSRASALQIAEAARRGVSAQRISKRSTGEMIGAVTVSFGLAVYRPGDSAPGLIERADQRLYAAKLSGRDRVVAEDPTHRAA